MLELDEKEVATIFTTLERSVQELDRYMETREYLTAGDSTHKLFNDVYDRRVKLLRKVRNYLNSLGVDTTVGS